MISSTHFEEHFEEKTQYRPPGLARLRDIDYCVYLVGLYHSVHCSFHSQSQAASPELTTAPIDDCCRSTRQLFYLICHNRTRRALAQGNGYCCPNHLRFVVMRCCLRTSFTVKCCALRIYRESTWNFCLFSFAGCRAGAPRLVRLGASRGTRCVHVTRRSGRPLFLSHACAASLVT